MKLHIQLFFLLFFVSFSSEAQQKHDYKISQASMIWDKSGHNAFTTLAGFDGFLYCAFREASSHRSYNGKIRIIRSKDLINWKSVALISSRLEDLRDPKLIVSNGRIELLFVSRNQNEHFSYTYFSDNGTKWKFYGKEDGTWRWNATLFDDAIYSVGYSGNDKSGHLYKKTKGAEWTSVKKNFFKNINTQPSETKLFFTVKGKMVALVRNEKGRQFANLGVSDTPYTSWRWSDLDLRIGSPSGLVLNNEEIITIVRTYNPMKTSIIKINTDDVTYEVLSVLPSGGDTGYADITEYNGEYYISYYSSNNKEKKASIYLVKIDL